MLTEAQIKKLVVVRILKLEGCQDRNYLWHHIGVIRGLLWSLTGRDQGDLSRIDDILNVLSVPYVKSPSGDTVIVDEDWLEANKIKV